MSLSNVYPYFRSRMKGLGYKEHDEGFDRDNIPSTVLNKSFHILSSSGSGGTINQNHQEVGVDINLRYCIRGYRKPTDAKETALKEMQTILEDICNITNRTSTLFNVVFNDFSMEQLSESNDNVVVTDLGFTAFVILAMR